MTPANIASHPSIFWVSKTWFNNIQPAITAKTDSIDRIIAAGAGLTDNDWGAKIKFRRYWW